MVFFLYTRAYVLNIHSNLLDEAILLRRSYILFCKTNNRTKVYPKMSPKETSYH